MFWKFHLTSSGLDTLLSKEVQAVYIIWISLVSHLSLNFQTSYPCSLLCRFARETVVAVCHFEMTRVVLAGGVLDGHCF